MNEYFEYFLIGFCPFVPLIAVLLAERRLLIKEIAEVAKMREAIK